jgi:uncharacterized DUF497 family protein
MSKELEEGFEWDLAKDLENFRKHGVGFGEAAETFLDPCGFTMRDEKHSTEEEPRFFWVGKSQAGRVLTTRYTERGGRIRIIGSAQWRRYRKLYEATQNTRPENRHG